MASYYDSNTDDTNTLIILMTLIQIINSELTLVFNWFIACILYCSTHNILLLTLLTTSSTDQISPHIHQELQQSPGFAYSNSCRFSAKHIGSSVRKNISMEICRKTNVYI